jgi:pyrroloquinoline-quinone synthase
MPPALSTVVDAAIEGRRLLSHPFYQRWERGELDVIELARYAEQYRFFEAYLPEFLTALAARVANGTTRESLLANLDDEITEPSHLSLFNRFADAYGAHDAPISPAMSALLDAYATALDDSDAVAVAGLLAYEVQGAAIADSKHDGLKRHYGGTSPAIDFWSAHGSIEDDHAAWAMAGLAALSPSHEEVARGAGLVAQAWWDFLSEREALALV